MNLPSFFIADLPREATLTGPMLTEACQTLKRNRERYLANRSTPGIVSLLSSVAADWLKPEFPFRRLALDQGPAETGFSSRTIAKGLDRLFCQLTAANFKALLEQDLGSAERLDRMSANAGEQNAGRAALVRGPELLVHITAGNVPAPALMSMVLGVLVRSAQFVKCASGAAFLPRLFAHSLYDADPKLGACIEIAEWRGGHHPLENVLFEAADCVTATGADKTLTEIAHRLPANVRFLRYGLRVSFGYISAEVLSGFTARRMVERAVEDIVAWNQLGCLSPHVIYVQAGGTVGPEMFAEMLADGLRDREESDPRGELTHEAAAAIASRRGIYEIRAAHSPGTRHWHSKESTAWTVVYEADPQFQFSCLNRFIYIKPVKDLTEALQNADSVRGQVSTVGLGAPEHRQQELATELARWGATRVCPLGRMQEPPLTWHHDGGPALGDLITWTDWEPG
ncbi:MAG TPA: acyl-CoA reductase [Verrucomicrobiae bacterium]